MEISKENGIAILKKWFCFSGRATRKDFWMTVLWLILANIAVGVLFGIVQSIFKDWLAGLLSIPFVFAFIALIVAAYANLFRRLHDLGLSGFWTCYLTPFGLPFLYGAYIMDADESAKAAVERIKAVGSPWLSWILAIILWCWASLFSMLLILLSPGQKQDNIYGPNPYAA